jgi:hypothetical protein
MGMRRPRSVPPSSSTSQAADPKAVIVGTADDGGRDDDDEDDDRHHVDDGERDDHYRERLRVHPALPRGAAGTDRRHLPLPIINIVLVVVVVVLLLTMSSSSPPPKMMTTMAMAMITTIIPRDPMRAVMIPRAGEAGVSGTHQDGESKRPLMALFFATNRDNGNEKSRYCSESASSGRW